MNLLQLTGRFMVSISILVLFSILYVFAYLGSNTSAPTSSSARLDLNVCGFQTPLTPRVVKAWNTVFYPLRAVEAAFTPGQDIEGELVPPPYPSHCVFIKRDSDAQLYCLLTKPEQPVKPESIRYGQKVIAETGMALDDNPNPPCLSKGSSGSRFYVRSLRLAQ
jgi:hypothetical protein